MKRFLITIMECTEGPGLSGHGYVEVLDFTQAGIFRSVGEEAGYIIADILSKMYPNSGLKRFNG